MPGAQPEEGDPDGKADDHEGEGHERFPHRTQGHDTQRHAERQNPYREQGGPQGLNTTLHHEDSVMVAISSLFQGAESGIKILSNRD